LQNQKRRRLENERTAVLEQDAEASRAAIAEANARAAEAGQKAEEERLARVKLEQALRPRHLTREQAKAVGEFVRDHLPNLMLAYTGWDHESSWLASEIGFAVQEARPQKGGPLQLVLNTPQGASSTLIVPDLKKRISSRLLSKKDIDEIMGPFFELGFGITEHTLFPEYPDVPILYIAPKAPPQIGDAKPWFAVPPDAKTGPQ